VAAHALVAVGAERVADVIGGSPGDLDELVLAVGAQPRDRGLDHVAVAVELVAPLEIRVAMRDAAVAEARVEVPVLLLRGGHLRGDVLDQVVERTGPRESLDHLVDVGVRELASRLRQRVAEVVDPTQPRLPAVTVREQHRTVEFLPGAPEAARDRDVVERAQRARAGVDRSSHGALLS
jgi:hypothetical protein